MVMGIQYEDQRAVVYDRELVTLMAKLAISLTMLDQIRQAQDEDGLSNSWLAHPGLTRDVDEFV